MNTFEALKAALGTSGLAELGIQDDGSLPVTVVVSDLIEGALALERAANAVSPEPLPTPMPPKWALLELNEAGLPAPSRSDDVDAAMGQFGLLQSRLGLVDRQLEAADLKPHIKSIEGDYYICVTDGGDTVYWSGKSAFSGDLSDSKAYGTESAAKKDMPKAKAAIKELLDEAELGEMSAKAAADTVSGSSQLDGVDPKVAKLLVKSGLKDGDKNDDKIKVNKRKVKAGALKPSQKTMVLGKSLGMALAMILGKMPLGGDLGAIISSDNHILDGHHRWAAAIMAGGKGVSVGGYKADLEGKRLLGALNIVSKGMFGVRNGKAGKGSIANFTPKNAEKELRSLLKSGTQFLSADDVRKALEKAGDGDVEAGIAKLSDNTGKVSKAVPSWAPDRKQMPVIEPDQVPAAAKAMKRGKVDWSAPLFKSESDVSEGRKVSAKRMFVKSVMARSKGRPIDPDEYPAIKGMEGPFSFKKSGILYYDPKEGRYYNSKSDMYLDRDDLPEEDLDEKGNPYHAAPDPSAPVGSTKRRGGQFVSRDDLARAAKGSIALRGHKGPPKSKSKVVGSDKKSGRLKGKKTPQDCGRAARASGEDVLCHTGKTKSGQSGSKKARQKRKSVAAGRVGRGWRKGRTDRAIGRAMRRKESGFDAPDNMVEASSVEYTMAHQAGAAARKSGKLGRNMDVAAAEWLKGNGPAGRKERANVESAFNLGWLGKKMPAWMSEAQIDDIEKLVGKKISGEGRYSIDGLPFDLMDAGGGDVGLKPVDRDAATALLKRLRGAKMRARFDKKKGVIFIEAKEPNHPEWKKRQKKGFDADGDGKTNEPMPAKLKKALKNEGDAGDETDFGESGLRWAKRPLSLIEKIRALDA